MPGEQMPGEDAHEGLVRVDRVVLQVPHPLDDADHERGPDGHHQRQLAHDVETCDATSIGGDSKRSVQRAAQRRALGSAGQE
ncbi:MAG: hypothetical protein M0010_08975 [Actinomycetota bacterium]|nr:hypothetical protein [Actinomycetota bacterium]